MHYHAHVYFDLENKKSAYAFYQLAGSQAKSLLQVYGFIEKPIGPHPKPMFEIHFQQEQKQTVLHWLESHRGIHSVLVHEETGDDYKDHESGALWLGEKLTLNTSFFDLVKRDPTQLIHRK
jgi:DOPA 4,5-dioxygenase